jgi:hypothetical protein
MENLDATNAFSDLRSRAEQTTEDGQIESALEMVYRPGQASDQQPAAAPAAGGDRR